MGLILVIFGTALFYASVFCTVNERAALVGRARFFLSVFIPLTFLILVLPPVGPRIGSIAWAEVFVIGLILSLFVIAAMPREGMRGVENFILKKEREGV
jgi:hypothetical protein